MKKRKMRITTTPPAEPEKTAMPRIREDWPVIESGNRGALAPVLDVDSYIRGMTEDMLAWLLRKAGYRIAYRPGRMVWWRYGAPGLRKYYWYLGDDRNLHMLAAEYRDDREGHASAPDPGSLLFRILSRGDNASSEAMTILHPVLSALDGKRREE